MRTPERDDLSISEDFISAVILRRTISSSPAFYFTIQGRFVEIVRTPSMIASVNLKVILPLLKELFLVCNILKPPPVMPRHANWSARLARKPDELPFTRSTRNPTLMASAEHAKIIGNPRLEGMCEVLTTTSNPLGTST